MSATVFSLTFLNTLYPHVLRFLIPSLVIQCLINAPCSYFRRMDNFTGLVEFLGGLIWSFDYLVKSQPYCCHFRIIVTSLCVVLWSIRLSTFLIYRMIILGPVDARIDHLIKKYGYKGLFAFWLCGHGLWSTLCCLPIALLHALPMATSPLTAFDILGLSLWICGFLLEAAADQTKLTAKRIGKRNLYHLGGLWNYCRNPNHCGEVFCWLGLSIVSLNILFYHPIYRWNFWIFIFSQLGCIFTLFIMLGEATLSTEIKNNKRYGHLFDYHQYRRQTSLLWPIPSRLYLLLPQKIRTTIFFEWNLYNEGLKSARY